MLLKKTLVTGLLTLAAFALQAQTAGDPSIQIDDAIAAPGDTGIILGGAFTNDSGGLSDIAVAGQFDVIADTGLTVQGQASDGGGGWVDCPTTQFPAGGITVSCSEPLAQTTRYVLEQGANNPLPNATDWFRFSVDVGAAVAPGTLNLTIAADGYSDANAVDMPPGSFGGNNDNGVITVQAPAGEGFYASTPAPGGNLALGSAVVGNTTAPAV
ncbi:MAG: hypothetical protein PF630_05865, partial [Gammaproteobacteria bacterium]|nr:hypothetical protein [Gammaproteobacteria bacterium]